MKLSSSILARIAGALGDKVAGRESLQAQDLALPASISPIITLLGPFGIRVQASAPVNARESFLFGAAQIQAPSSAAVIVPLGSLGRGAWRLFFSFCSWSDFQMTPTGQFNYMRLFDTIGAFEVRLIRTFPVTNVPQYGQLQFDVVLAEDGWACQGIAGATIAAQNMVCDFAVVAQRLL